MDLNFKTYILFHLGEISEVIWQIKDTLKFTPTTSLFKQHILELSEYGLSELNTVMNKIEDYKDDKNDCD